MCYNGTEGVDRQMVQLKNLTNNCHAVYLEESKEIYGFSYELNMAVYRVDTNELFINKEALGYSYTTQKHLYLFIRECGGIDIHSQKELDNLIKEGKVKFM